MLQYKWSDNSKCEVIYYQLLHADNNKSDCKDKIIVTTVAHALLFSHQTRIGKIMSSQLIDNFLDEKVFYNENKSVYLTRINVGMKWGFLISMGIPGQLTATALVVDKWWSIKYNFNIIWNIFT